MTRQNPGMLLTHPNRATFFSLYIYGIDLFQLFSSSFSFSSSPYIAKANQKKYLVSGIPTDPLFFKKGKKRKKRGHGFQMASCNYALFFLQRQFRLYLLRKDGRGLVIVRRPTDLQLRETVGIPETRYFFWLA